ncbi:hypothetical protein BCR39DRAFT_552915 [Naematelia encephala]|uniref:Uncharacterized protein n=1 Tax=Naematelia encephala TaxID=71784 RepID=A0A1Y2AGN0_9TREE|nr:hypothetical protein BCR39DRAFT_552915 [Naematelia encephala]
MPALDPLSGNSRPFLHPDSQPSKPLKFAATILHPLDSNKVNSLPHQHLPKPRREKDGTPNHFPQPPYRHDRQPSSSSLANEFDSLSVGHTAVIDAFVIGSDEWMRVQVAQCVDNAQNSLYLAGKGLTVLSTKIADLRDLVTLPSSFSPRATATQRPAASPTASPVASPFAPSPGTGGFAGNARSFSRTVSAPASAANFRNGVLAPNPTSVRILSGLRGEGPLLHSPALTETSEPETSSPHLLASPSFPAPGHLSPLGQRNSSWGRSKTGALHFGTAGVQSQPMDVDVNLARNSLTSLPSALFEISNLTLLTLHRNSLTALPAAIGELHHLRTLNIGNNSITKLPSTILHLALTVFSPHPNPFIPIPIAKGSADAEAGSGSGRILSALESRSSHPVPRLSDICVNLLISPRPQSNLPPLLDHFDWAPSKGEIHPLLDPEILHQQLQIPSISEEDVKRMLQALRGASFAQSHLQGSARRGSNVSAVGVQARVDPFPRSHRPLPPDDASANPYYCPCPSPRHFELDTSSHPVTRPTRHVFLQAAESRIEWREVFGVSDLPIEWKGCSPGCLAFLEEDGDEWDMTEE